MKIAISSGKGGTGKTTLAVNLASCMAQSREVVLVDLDVEEPNSGLFVKGNCLHREDKYKMYPEWQPDTCAACGQCQEVCNFNAIVRLGNEVMVFPQLCHSCYACAGLCPTQSLKMVPQKMGELIHYKHQNLDFVESRLTVGQEQAVPLIAQTLGYVEDTFPGGGFQIFDSPPGTSCPVIEATKNADFVVLVTEPTPFGLHDLKLAVETMRKLGRKFGVVINRYGIGNKDVDKYCKTERIPVIATIPNSREIAEHYAQGRLVYADVPVFRRGLEKIKSYLQTMHQVVSA